MSVNPYQAPEAESPQRSPQLPGDDLPGTPALIYVLCILVAIHFLVSLASAVTGIFIGNPVAFVGGLVAASFCVAIFVGLLLNHEWARLNLILFCYVGDDEIKKKVSKKSKYFDQVNGDLTIGGALTEIDEGNFALHFMMAFLGKAWIAGETKVQYNGKDLINEPFRVCNTFAAFTGAKGQLNGDIKYLADTVVKNTIKALKKVA